jgi:hypothetical protein
VQLENKDLDQLLHLLIQTRRLTKLAVSTNTISYSEQELILQEVEQASTVLKKIGESIQGKSTRKAATTIKEDIL